MNVLWATVAGTMLIGFALFFFFGFRMIARTLRDLKHAPRFAPLVHGTVLSASTSTGFACPHCGDDGYGERRGGVLVLRCYWYKLYWAVGRIETRLECSECDDYHGLTVNGKPLELWEKVPQ